MTYRNLMIGVLLIFAFSSKIISQDLSPIEKSIEIFNSFSNDSSDYSLEFIKEKNTLYFRYRLSEKKSFGYKTILEDIHPEGIFIIEKENNTFLRILSIHNEKVFVKEKFRGKFRLSNNINLIDIELDKTINENTLSDLVHSLKSIFVKEKKDIPIQIEPPKTKNEK